MRFQGGPPGMSFAENSTFHKMGEDELGKLLN